MRRPKIEQVETILLEKELNSYRQWAAELQEEAREPGGSCNCDSEVWEYFNPAFPCGKQIYESFTDEELLDMLLPTMEYPGHTPRFQEIHEIYRRYLARRFGDLSRAKDLARIRYKRRRDEQRWPWDWPERVSAEPALNYCRQRGLCLSQEEQTLLKHICQVARSTRMPPALSQSQVRYLQRLGGVRQIFELMGIPRLERGALKYMRSYWRRQAALAKDTETKETDHKEGTFE